MKINLTQHEGTPEQGVTEPKDKERVRALLTFDTLPTREEIQRRAKCLAAIAEAELGYGPGSAMIGGAPFLMGPLSAALEEVGVKPIFAFSVRESVDQKQEDGSVRKVAVFRHLGFVGEEGAE